MVDSGGLWLADSLVTFYRPSSSAILNCAYRILGHDITLHVMSTILTIYPTAPRMDNGPTMTVVFGTPF